MDKYIGKFIEIIYIDKTGKITKRQVKALSVDFAVLKAMDKSTGEYRTFRVENILAYLPAKVDCVHAS